MEPDVDFGRFFAIYKTAVLSKNVDMLMSIYGMDFSAFDMWSPWSHDGNAAWRSMNDEWLSSLGSESVRVDFDDIEIVPGSDVAAAYATVSYQAVSESGAILRSMQNRLTWVAKREGGTWTIVHQHTSAPIDADTMTAILHR